MVAKTDLGQSQFKYFFQAENSFLQDLWRRLKMNKVALVCLSIIVLLYTLAILAPFIAPYDIEEMDFDNLWGAPSRHHPMGTDGMGRDLLTLVLYGSRVSLSVGLISMMIAVTIGTGIGAVSGYYGGLVDRILMSLTEIGLCFPSFFLVLTIVALFGNGIYKVMMIIGLTSWMGVARLVRGQFLTLKERDFVESAKVLGISDLRIILIHILPNALAPIIVSATLRVGGAILTEAVMSFLGLGVKQGTVSWGGLLKEAQSISVMLETPWVAIFPGIFIFIIVLSFNVLGDGLRDALDPRT